MADSGETTTRGWLSAVRERFRPDVNTLHLLFKALGRAFLGVLLAWINPFDLFSKADEASSNAFQYFMAEFIPHESHDPPPITVVLFTPSAMDALTKGLEESWTWPLSFKQQAAFLDKLAAYHPKALFYDIEFYQEREGVDAFHDALVRVTKVPADPKWNCVAPNFPTGIPVFMAKPPEPLPILEPICDAGVNAANVLWNGRPNLYPVAARDGPYPRLPTPAKLLFKVACDKFEVDTTRCTDTEKEQADINLVWRKEYGQSQQLIYNRDLPPECYALKDDSGFANASSKAERLVTTCPATYVINADKILLDGSQGSNEALQAALTNKFVLIGAEFPGMRDRVDTPYFGRVPGIFSHLAALDNLTDWGPRYIHAFDDTRFLSRFRFGQFVIVAMCLFVIAYVIEKLRKFAPSLARLTHEEAPTWRHSTDALIVLACIVGLIVGVAAVLLGISSLLFFWRRLAPLNWIGELAIVWVFAFEETARAILLVLLVFPLFSRKMRAIAYHLVEPPEEKHG